MTTSARREPGSLWAFRPGLARASGGPFGYAVEATDGAVGHVIAAGEGLGASYVIAAGGPWNGGRMVMLPAGVIERVDHDALAVVLACSREQIAGAPPFEGDRYQDGAYRAELGEYYARLGAPDVHGAAASAVSRLQRAVRVPGPQPVPRGRLA